MNWSRNDNYSTPEYIYEALNMEFGFDDFDPCPLDPDWNPRESVDGLKLDWNNRRIFCNPPWSVITPWINKAYASQALTVLLLPARTDTAWFARVTASPANTEVRFFRKRVRFIQGEEKKNPTDGTMVVIIRNMR